MLRRWGAWAAMCWSCSVWGQEAAPEAARRSSPGPAASATAAAAPPKSYVGAPISLNFQNIELRTLLQILAEHSGFNIIAADSVTGSLSIRLRDVPWDQALDAVLQARGLASRREAGVIWVAPQAELAARQRQELEGQQALQTVEGVRTQGFRLNYARADDLARQLLSATGAARLLSPRGSALAEPRTNQLFITDVPSRVALVENLVRQIDIPVRQVMIEARIVEAVDTFGKSLGVRLGGRPLANPAAEGNPNLSGGQAGGGYVQPRAPATGAPLAGRDFGIAGSDFVNLPASALNGQVPAALAVSLFNASLTRVLNLELSALEADGKGEIVASPRIVTADQVKAIIEQGTELPYQQATASGATAVTFRKANLKLEVTPQITPEGGIILNVDVSKDSVGRSTPNGFAIDTKHVQTQVLVENGGTVMIGGIFETVERSDEARVPLLGRVPGLGALFRSRGRSLSKSELLVFITPQVLSATVPAR